jgi:predicted nucleotidyltransferase
MDKTTINKIKKFFEDKPVIRAYVFGSHARGEETKESDIDILVDLDHSTPVGLKFYTMQAELEELLRTKVDLISTNGISKYIKPYIEKDKKLIYEREYKQ